MMMIQEVCASDGFNGAVREDGFGRTFSKEDVERRNGGDVDGQVAGVDGIAGSILEHGGDGGALVGEHEEALDLAHARRLEPRAPDLAAGLGAEDDRARRRRHLVPRRPREALDCGAAARIVAAATAAAAGEGAEADAAEQSLARRRDFGGGRGASSRGGAQLDAVLRWITLRRRLALLWKILEADVERGGVLLEDEDDLAAERVEEELDDAVVGHPAAAVVVSLGEHLRDVPRAALDRVRDVRDAELVLRVDGDDDVAGDGDVENARRLGHLEDGFSADAVLLALALALGDEFVQSFVFLTLIFIVVI